MPELDRPNMREVRGFSAARPMPAEVVNANGKVYYFTTKLVMLRGGRVLPIHYYAPRPAEEEPAADAAVGLSDWYSHLLVPPDGREVSEAEEASALAAVRLAMSGIEQAISEGRITQVQVSFELPPPVAEGDTMGFNFSSPE